MCCSLWHFWLHRLGVPPVRIEISTSISGVDFAECCAHRVEDTLDGVPANLIGLEHLKANKQASGRHQDLADLEHLPQGQRPKFEIRISKLKTKAKSKSQMAKTLTPSKRPF